MFKTILITIWLGVLLFFIIQMFRKMPKETRKTSVRNLSYATGLSILSMLIVSAFIYIF